MSRFFTDKPLNSKIIVRGEDAVHMRKSLRMKVSDKVFACDGDGQDYVCEISHMEKDEITLDVLEECENKAEPSVEVTLFMALAKSDKFELICQKCTELGISRIVPFIASRSIAKPSEEEKKRLRREKICMEASKQCGRGKVPIVLETKTFEKALHMSKQSDLSLILNENEHNTSMKQALSSKEFKKISIMVGPEGGFEQDEVQLAQEMGLVSVTLGNRILRCETAPIAAVSVIMFFSDNL